MRYLLVIGLILGSFSLQAQEFEKEMKAIISKIDTTKSISISVKVAVYSKKGGSLVYSMVSTVDHSKGNTITHLGEMEMYQSEKYEVQVDHEEKRMMVRKKTVVKEADFSDLNLKELKKLVAAEGDVEAKKPKFTLVSNNNGIKTYSITGSEGIKELQIVLDTKTEKIQKISYEYTEDGPNKGQYCVLEYDKFDYSPSFTSTFFDSKNYFSYVNKSYVPAKRLSTYKLITE